MQTLENCDWKNPKRLQEYTKTFETGFESILLKLHQVTHLSSITSTYCIVLCCSCNYMYSTFWGTDTMQRVISFQEQNLKCINWCAAAVTKHSQLMYPYPKGFSWHLHKLTNFMQNHQMYKCISVFIHINKKIIYIVTLQLFVERYIDDWRLSSSSIENKTLFH